MKILEQTKNIVADSPVGSWYAGKAKTDRLVIIIVLGLVIVCLFYLTIWQPAADFKEENAARFARELGLSEWITLNKSSLKKASQGQGNKQQQGGLIPTITSSANKLKIQLGRLQPESNGSVSVVLQNQEFNSTLRWLTLLEQQGFQVERLTIDRTDLPGLINAQARFFR